MTRPDAIDRPGGPGMGPGSAHEQQLRKTDAVVARTLKRTDEALFAIDAQLRESTRQYNALVERVAAAAQATDPREALTHLLAEVRAEQKAKERR